MRIMKEPHDRSSTCTFRSRFGFKWPPLITLHRRVVLHTRFGASHLLYLCQNLLALLLSRLLTRAFMFLFLRPRNVEYQKDLGARSEPKCHFTHLTSMSYAGPLQWMGKLASTQGGCRHCSHLQATEKHLLYWMRVRGCVCVCSCVCVCECKVCVCVCVCQGSLICCVVLVKTHTCRHTHMFSISSRSEVCVGFNIASKAVRTTHPA